jgi:hypothetical protein
MIRSGDIFLERSEKNHDSTSQALALSDPPTVETNMPSEDMQSKIPPQGSNKIL